MAATMTKYEPEAKRERPVTYRSRAFTDSESRYSQPEKEAKAVEWGIFANTFEVDTDHKPLAQLLSGYRTTAPLHIERGYASAFNYRLNYIPGKEEAEGNEADYHSWHPEPLATQKSQVSKNYAELELREMVEEFRRISWLL